MADAGSSDPRRRRRLSRSGDFDRVYREGDSRGNRFFVVHGFDSGEAGGPRLGVSVGRRIGKAVQRNKVKRAVREAFWELAEGLPGGRDYVIVARPDAEGLVRREGAKGVRAALAELLGTEGGDGERLS